MSLMAILSSEKTSATPLSPASRIRSSVDLVQFAASSTANRLDAARVGRAGSHVRMAVAATTPGGRGSGDARPRSEGAGVLLCPAPCARACSPVGGAVGGGLWLGRGGRGWEDGAAGRSIVVDSPVNLELGRRRSRARPSRTYRRAAFSSTTARGRNPSHSPASTVAASRVPATEGPTIVGVECRGPCTVLAPRGGAAAFFSRGNLLADRQATHPDRPVDGEVRGPIRQVRGSGHEGGQGLLTSLPLLNFPPCIQKRAEHRCSK